MDTFGERRRTSSASHSSPTESFERIDYEQHQLRVRASPRHRTGLDDDEEAQCRHLLGFVERLLGLLELSLTVPRTQTPSAGTQASPTFLASERNCTDPAPAQVQKAPKLAFVKKH